MLVSFFVYKFQHRSNDGNTYLENFGSRTNTRIFRFLFLLWFTYNMTTTIKCDPIFFLDFSISSDLGGESSLGGKDRLAFPQFVTAIARIAEEIVLKDHLVATMSERLHYLCQHLEQKIQRYEKTGGGCCWVFVFCCCYGSSFVVVVALTDCGLCCYIFVHCLDCSQQQWGKLKSFTKRLAVTSKMLKEGEKKHHHHHHKHKKGAKKKQHSKKK